MKKKILSIIAVLICAASCSLDEQYNSATKSEGYYNDKATCLTGLNACYNAIRVQFGGASFWMVTECTTDLMFLNLSVLYNATLNISPTKPEFSSIIWRYCYLGVMRANAIKKAIEDCIAEGNISEEDGLPMIGEAVVLRAFFYYYLTCSFGNVPFYTDVVTEDNREQIASLPRMPANDTRDALINELKHYLMPEALGGREFLPLKRSYDPPFENRMTAAVGLIIAGKFCLWNERWDDAVRIFNVLEDIYGQYKNNPEQFAIDYPISDIPFSKKFVKESIFEMENAFEEYGVQASGTIAMYATPPKTSNAKVTIEGDDEENLEYVISDVYNGIAIPELGENSRISISARPTTYYYQTVLSYNSPDLRSGDYSNDSEVSRNGAGNLAWRWKGYAQDDIERLPEDNKARWFSSSFKASLRPWLGNKFWCPDMYYVMDSNNYKLFRFADVELMLAEAHLRLGQYDDAAAYLNITRVRAGLPKITLASVGGNVEAFMEEIRLERARELFGEFQRKYDLVRWGIWYERTSQYNDGMYLPDFILPCHRYLPIPAEQITYSHGALDNKEYEQ